MKVAEHVAEFRQNRELLDRLTGGKPVDIEAEHSTGDTAPGVTLEHIARSLSDDRRCLLLARPDTAERIAGRIDNEPKCMRTYSDEDGAHRLYNANGDLRVGPNDVRVYRQASGESVWLYHASENSVELQTEDGKTLASFSDPEAVFSDPTEYPATESDIEDPDECQRRD